MTTPNKYKNHLNPLTSKARTFDFVGFDIETYNNNGVQEFYFGGLYYYQNGKEVYEYYDDKELMIARLLTPFFKNKYIVATNLGFDYSSLFYKTKYWNDIKLIYRGSDIITCVYKLPNKQGSIRFIDTMNYAPFSVEKLGNILKTPKLDKPDYIGKRKSLTKEELNYFIEYNKYDCKISCDFMYFLQKAINLLGGELKLTIASTSLDVFRRQFLVHRLKKENNIIKNFDVKSYIFNGYYGGRTEVFERGKFYNMNYYDINSLYPSQMLKKVPEPNSVFIPEDVNINNILKYEGTSHVRVITPDKIKYPILPYRDKTNKKLIFPKGTWNGYYNHNELRYAINNGYIIEPISHVCYRNSIYLFKNYVTTLYDLRLKYKAENNKMELVTKLCLNSLYGKFAQRSRENITITDLNNVTGKELATLLFEDSGDIKENFHILREVTEFDGVFSFPIFSSYITSYARITLHKYIVNHNPVYCDTDSIITADTLEVSSELGAMKLEGKLLECEFYKPKFYRATFDNGKQIVKVKGVNRCTTEDFDKILRKETVNKLKFSKIKESIRHGISPNTMIIVPKILDLNDNKRVWNDNISMPIIINQ